MNIIRVSVTPDVTCHRAADICALTHLQFNFCNRYWSMFDMHFLSRDLQVPTKPCRAPDYEFDPSWPSCFSSVGSDNGLVADHDCMSFDPGSTSSAFVSRVSKLQIPFMAWIFTIFIIASKLSTVEFWIDHMWCNYILIYFNILMYHFNEPEHFGCLPSQHETWKGGQVRNMFIDCKKL